MDKKILLIVALACASGVASAQDSSLRPAKGTKEFGISATWTSVSGSSSNGIAGDGGYYFTPNLVGEVAYTWLSTSGGGSSSSIFVGPRYEFNVSGQLVPYVVAGLTFGSTGTDHSSSFRAGAGANYSWRPNMALFAELAFYKPSGNDTVTSFGLGLRVFFK